MESITTCNLSLRGKPSENVQAAIEGLAKTLFLGVDDSGDVILPSRHLRENMPHSFTQRANQLMNEGVVLIELAGIARGAAQDAAQDVPPALVGGHRAVGHGEAERTHVVGDDLHGDAVLTAVLFARQFGDATDKRLKDIGLVVVLGPL